MVYLNSISYYLLILLDKLCALPTRYAHIAYWLISDLFYWLISDAFISILLFLFILMMICL